MRSLLEGLWLQTVVLWLAPLAERDDGSLGRDLLFVSAPVVEALRPLVREIVLPPGPGGRATAALAGPVLALLLPEQEAQARAWREVLPAALQA